MIALKKGRRVSGNQMLASQYLAPSPDLAAHQASLRASDRAKFGRRVWSIGGAPLPARFLRKRHVCIEGFRPERPTNQCEMQSVMIELLIGAV